jgi:hypothetical protein
MAERFTLLTELGRGGMGVVWKARDEDTGQIVALKVMREMYAEDADYVARFERELELAKRINSVHVVIAMTALVMVGSDENLGMRSGSVRLCLVLGLAVLAGCWQAWQNFSGSLVGGEAHVQFGLVVAWLGGSAILVGPVVWAVTRQARTVSSRMTQGPPRGPASSGVSR